jgi:hypothetical protein
MSEKLPKPHPREGATYQILEFPDGTFGVEVAIRESQPTTVSGLAHRASAEAWIVSHQAQVAAGGPAKRQFFRRGWRDGEQ